jgi:hypothetical protein
MSCFPYHYNSKNTAHQKIYGDYDAYYYSMRILRAYLSNLEKYQGIYKFDLGDQTDYESLFHNIKDRVITRETESQARESQATDLPNENTVYKIIRSISKEHFLKFIKTFCKNNDILYTTNLNKIDIREFLAFACGELIILYKSEIIEGWNGDKWEKVHSATCRVYTT